MVNLSEKLNLTRCLVVCAALLSSAAFAELPVETVPAVEKLDADYPQSMVFAHDANFEALIAGRVVLVDVAPDNRHYKGALDASQFPSFTESGVRGELYVAETHYSRGTRGERTDVISIYDRETLGQTGEIFLPGAKRGLVVVNRYSLQLVDSDRYMFVFNFTPAASITMIDVAERKILSETQIPGCALAYPTGERGFSSLCSNGTFVSVQFDKAGQVVSREVTQSFFDVDQDPLFDKPVYVDQTAYFQTFKGQIYPVDLSGSVAKVGKPWSMLSSAEAKEGWRPGGWQIGTASDAGLVYVLMSPDGKDGSHKDGGSEAWVYDPVERERVNRISLKNWSVSLEVTRGDEPYLVATNADMQLDVYEAKSGEWIRVIGGAGAMPLNLHAVR
tara:strand:+ start:836 stop:2002 length:1167 start_codon:yes stop_codon:yes gene_type:complete